jgi:hypothetical protein
MSSEPRETQATGLPGQGWPGQELRALCRRGTRRQFEQEHPCLWLVRELAAASAPPEASFSTTLVTAAQLRAAMGGLARRIGAAPQGFLFLPLRKSERNPWQDRVLIGRASNNDVVLRDASVSKVHARAMVEGGGWAIADAKSTNGTWVDGEQRAPGKAVALRSQAVVKLGGVTCTVFTSAEVFDALSVAFTRPPL